MRVRLPQLEGMLDVATQDVAGEGTPSCVERGAAVESNGSRGFLESYACIARLQIVR